MSWRNFVTDVQRKRELDQARDDTRNKMAAFLDAAASGKLWTNRSETQSEQDANHGSTSCHNVSVSSSVKMHWILGIYFSRVIFLISTFRLHSY